MPRYTGLNATTARSAFEPDADAPLAAEYVRLRADGTNRAALVRRLKIPWPVTSLNGMEWNALTYAGHTVWNVYNEQTPEGYKDGEKRRPSGQMVIQRDTHPALISDAVAEALLVQLETLGTGNTRDPSAGVSVVGLLRTPTGDRWYGNRTAKAEFYRVKTLVGSRNMPVAKVDSIVVETVANDAAIKRTIRLADEGLFRKSTVVQTAGENPHLARDLGYAMLARSSNFGALDMTRGAHL